MNNFRRQQPSVKILGIDPGVDKRFDGRGMHTRLADGTFAPGHSGVGTPEHNSWRGIIQRCCNPRCKSYPDYGGRGIKMCPEWRTSFIQFLNDVGHRPTPRHTLGRIDNDGDYKPGNIEWTTYVEQSRNRRDSVILEHNGERLNLIEWANRLGMKQPTLWNRLNLHGWSVAKAIETPVKKWTART